MRLFLVVLCILNSVKTAIPGSPRSSLVDTHYNGKNSAEGDFSQQDFGLNSNSNQNYYNSANNYNRATSSFGSERGNVHEQQSYKTVQEEDSPASLKEIQDSYLESLVQLKTNPKTSGYSGVIDHYENYENGPPDTSFLIKGQRSNLKNEQLVGGDDYHFKTNSPFVSKYTSNEPHQFSTIIKDKNLHNSQSNYNNFHTTATTGFGEGSPRDNYYQDNPIKVVNPPNSFQQSYNNNQEPEIITAEDVFKNRYGRKLNNLNNLNSDFRPSEQFQPTYKTEAIVASSNKLSKGFTPSFGPPSKSSSSIESVNYSQDHHERNQNNNQNYPLGYSDYSEEPKLSRNNKEISINIPSVYEESSKIKESNNDHNNNYKVIYVKAPEQQHQQFPELPEYHHHQETLSLPPLPDQKTVLYLLSKTPHEHQTTKVISKPENNNKPDVYFVQYKNEQKLEQNPSNNFDYSNINNYPEVGGPYDLFKNILPSPSPPSSTLASIPNYGDIQGYSRSHSLPNQLNLNHQDLSIYPNNILTPQPVPTFASLLQNSQMSYPNYPQQLINFGGGASPLLAGHLGSRENGFMMTYAPTFAPNAPNTIPPNHYYMDGNTIADLLKAYGIEHSNSNTNANLYKLHPDSNGSGSETNSKVSEDDELEKPEVREKFARSAELETNSVKKNTVNANESRISVSVSQSQSEAEPTVSTEVSTTPTEQSTTTEAPSTTIKTTTKPATTKTKLSTKTSTSSTKKSTPTTTTEAPSTSTTPKLTTKKPAKTKTTTKSPKKVTTKTITTTTTTEPPTTTTSQSIHIKIPLLPQEDYEEDQEDNPEPKQKDPKEPKDSEESDEVNSNSEEEIEPEVADNLDVNSELTSSEEAAIEENSLETQTESENAGNNQVPLFFESERINEDENNNKNSKEEDKVLSSSEEREFKRKIRIKPSEAKRLRGHKKITKVKKSKKNKRKKKHLEDDDDT